MIAAAFVAVAAGATLLRVLVTAAQPAGRIPWRTLAVNTSGAFLLGMVVAGGWFDDPVVATTAGLGSFTTFSTVAAETGGLLDDGHRGRAAIYIGLTVSLGVAAAWLGLAAGG